MRISSFLMATALLACAPTAATPPQAPQPMELPTSVSDADYAPFVVPGKGSLSGQAFLTTRGGDVKVAAGRTVTLDPATPYARAWLKTYGSDLARTEELPPDLRFQHARRTTVADGQGKFHFDNLPTGSYIVRTVVTWETGAQYAGLQGGVVASTVDVSDAKPTEVIVNTPVYPPGSMVAMAPLLSQEQIAGRPYKTLKRLSGVSCNRSGGDAISEEEARTALARNAAQLKADAVINVVCKGGGVDWKNNCWQTFKCEGDAITWS